MTIEGVLRKLQKVRKSGDGWIACCPAHDDRTPSMSIRRGNTGKILLYCHAGCSYQEIASVLGLKENEEIHVPRRKRRVRDKVRPASHGLDELASLYQMLLPDSVAETYLAMRSISLKTAQKAGVGYAPPGLWRHQNSAGEPVKQGTEGRIVFPQTDPEGNIINFYGRAIEVHSIAQKEDKHDNLVGNKAYFNGRSIYREHGSLVVCEGPFDALSVLEFGHPRVVAICGIGGWRDEWCQGLQKVILAFDNDDSGKKAALNLISRIPDECAKSVDILHEDKYRGYKDLNEALANGGLEL